MPIVQSSNFTQVVLTMRLNHAQKMTGGAVTNAEVQAGTFIARAINLQKKTCKWFNASLVQSVGKDVGITLRAWACQLMLFQVNYISMLPYVQFSCSFRRSVIIWCRVLCVLYIYWRGGHDGSQFLH